MSARRRTARVAATGALAVGLFALSAGTALGAFPYTRAGGNPSNFTDLYLGPGQVPNDLGGNTFKFAASPDPSNTVVNNNPVELGGVRGAHVVDAGAAFPTAWQTTLGRPDVTIAVTDSGIKWNDQGAMNDLRFKVRLNTGELPVPNAAGPALISGVNCAAYRPGPGVYDANGDGVVNLADYACDSRVNLSDPRRAGPTGFLTPQDLIIAFSNGTDGDGNGYVDDIAGWDFVDNDNDPFDDVQYGHGTGEAQDSSADTNNGGGDAAACPNCTVLPLRVGESFIADVNRFAEAVLYATDNRVLVIQEALGTLNNSSVARDAVNYAYRHGVVTAASAADEAAQHNNWPSSLPHTIVANSVRNSDPVPPPNNSYLAFNGCTNFNAKITIAIPSTSCSSNAVGLAAGYAGLIYSAALNGIAKDKMSRHASSGPAGCQLTFNLSGSPGNQVPGTPDACPITPNEVRQVMASGTINGVPQVDDVNFAGTPAGSGNEPSCSPVPLPGCTDPNGLLQAQVTANRVPPFPASTSYPARKGPDQFYGYGRANMNKAVKAILSDPATPAASKIPPEAEINSPTWYEQIDPGKATIDVSGQVFARGDTYRCQVYVAPGQYPNNALSTATPPGDFHAVPAAGGACDGTNRSAAVDGLLAKIDVATLKGYFPPETVATNFSGREPGSGVQTSSGRPDTEPYGFTVRVVATKTQGGMPISGQDQRAAYLHRDQNLLANFPRAITGGGQIKGAGSIPTSDGASSPAFADLNGDNRNEMIFGTSDGFVHALRPDGSELPGWPVRTDRPGFVHTGSRAFTSGEVSTNVGGAVLASVAIGDTNRDGIPEVYAADYEGNLYGWTPDGTRVFTQHTNPAFSGKPLAPFVNERHGAANRTQQGFIGSPVLADIDGDGRPEIVAASMDRHVYAWHGNGSPVPGYPVLVVDPSKVQSVNPTTDQVTFRSDAGALMQGGMIDTPAVANIAGDSRPEIIVGTNEEYSEPINAGLSGASLTALGAANALASQFGRGLLNFGNTRLYALYPDGNRHSEAPSATSAIRPGWPAKLGLLNRQLLPDVGEGVTGSPVVAPVNCPLGGGAGPKIGAIPNNGPGYIFNPSGGSCYGRDGSGNDNPLGTDLAVSPTKFDTPAFPAVGSPAFGTLTAGASVSMVAPVTGLLRALDVALPEYQRSQDFIGAWDAASGQFMPGYPSPVNDLQFLTGPAVADINGQPGEEVIEGTASRDLQAFNALGLPVDQSWPKVTSDWVVATPLVGSFGSAPDTNPASHKVVVSITRSGYISAYSTAAPACSPSSSPRFHHDNANSGDFSRDAVLPGKPTGLHHNGTLMELTVPGDDMLCGTANHYEIVTSNQPIDESNFNSATPLAGGPAPPPAGQQQSFPIPAGALRYVAIRAVDEQGNVGRAASIDRGPGSGGGGGGGGGPGGGAGGGGASQRQLRLKTMRKARHAPRRNCFKVTVTDSSGKAVPGATVKLGGRKPKLTKPNGTTRVCRRIRGRRKATITASKQGYTAASRQVRIRPRH